MYFFRVGLHRTVPYSSNGLTYVINALRRKFISLDKNPLNRIPTLWLALKTISEIWSRYDRWSSTIIPRSLTWCETVRGVPLME
jgi:hypothetical protein